MAKRIYTILGIVALAFLLYFIFYPGSMSLKGLLWTVTLLYALVIAGIFGILSHTLTPKQKGNLIFYPLILGILFALLVGIFLFIILPQVIPGFLNQ